MLCRLEPNYSHVLLAWASSYGAKKHMEKAHGVTFVAFYSAEMENLSKKGTKVV